MQNLTFTLWKDQGRRPYMEDACGVFKVDKHRIMFWVADGHSGGQISRFINDHIYKVTKAIFGSSSSDQNPHMLTKYESYDSEDDKENIKELFTTLSRRIVEEVPESSEAGSTLLTVLFCPKYYIIGNCGDSKAIWGCPINSTTNHNHNTNISDEPDITVHTLNWNTPFNMVIGTRGIFEDLENDEIMMFSKNPTNPAKHIVHMALKSGSSDNLSCIVIKS